MSENHQQNAGADGTLNEFASGDQRPLAALARDPELIAGIYEACDQWCAYCPVTSRCIAFRATNAAEVGAVFDVIEVEATGQRVAEGLQLQKLLADAEGRLAPPEIEAVLSGDRERARHVFEIDDPLERLGRRYMMLAAAYLHSRTDFPPDCRWRPEGPTAFEVLAWYHVLVPSRLFRAILADAEARHGVRGRRADTLRAAKLALVGLDRSARAIEELSVNEDDPRLELLRDLLHQLRDAVESRFTGARNYQRSGLDPEPVRGSTFQRGLRRLRTLLHWRDGRPAIDAPAGDLRGPARGAGHPRG
jgi:hypothetical protein